MNNRVNPLHGSLSNSLRTIDAVLLAKRLVRHISFSLDISHTEVEIIIGLASRLTPVDFDEVCEFIPHLSKDRVRRLVNRLLSKDLIVRHVDDSDHAVCYTVQIWVAAQIKNIDKVLLLS